MVPVWILFESKNKQAVIVVAITSQVVPYTPPTSGVTNDFYLLFLLLLLQGIEDVGGDRRARRGVVHT